MLKVAENFNATKWSKFEPGLKKERRQIKIAARQIRNNFWTVTLFVYTELAQKVSRYDEIN